MNSELKTLWYEEIPHWRCCKPRKILGYLLSTLKNRCYQYYRILRMILLHYKRIFIRLKNHPFISVVLTTRDNLDYFKPCVSSLLKQKYKNYEIIIIDQGGKDRTKEYVNSINFKNLKYKYLKYFGKFNHSLGRNNGIKLAKGEIIVCIDGDIIFNKYYLKSIAYIFNKNRKIFYECSRVQQKKTTKSLPFLQIKDICRSYGATQAMTKENFQKLKYDEKFKGAYCFDDELKERAEKNGLKYYYDKGNIILHPYHERTIKGYFDQIKKNRKLLERMRNEI